MRTDTCEIPVVHLCAWCKIKLSALPGVPPVVYRGYAVHRPCAQAAAAEDAANAAACREENSYPEPELARV